MVKKLKILQFVSIKEGLPEKSGDYICLMKSEQIVTVHYSSKHKMFNTDDELDKTDTNLNDRVVAWISNVSTEEIEQLKEAF